MIDDLLDEPERQTRKMSEAKIPTQAEIEKEIAAIEKKRAHMHLPGVLSDLYNSQWMIGAYHALSDAVKEALANECLAYDEGVQYGLAWLNGLNTIPPSEAE
jgi:hypothetical protein